MGVGDTPVKDISSAAVTHLQPGAHVDRHGEHNYFGKGPAIHTPDGQFHQIESPFGKPKPKPDTHQHSHIHATDTLIGTHSEHTQSQVAGNIHFRKLNVVWILSAAIFYFLRYKGKNENDSNNVKVGKNVRLQCPSESRGVLLIFM